ncbi:MAG: hypothetical protein ACK5JM_10175, partial [Rhodoblastus sp.]
NDDGLGPVVVGWATKASWLKANRSAALKALTALQMGYEAMQSHPELISKHAAHFTGIPAADAEAQAKQLGYFHPAAMPTRAARSIGPRAVHSGKGQSILENNGRLAGIRVRAENHQEEGRL